MKWNTSVTNGSHASESGHFLASAHKHFCAVSNEINDVFVHVCQCITTNRWTKCLPGHYNYKQYTYASSVWSTHYNKLLFRPLVKQRLTDRFPYNPLRILLNIINIASPLLHRGRSKELNPVKAASEDRVVVYQSSLSLGTTPRKRQFKGATRRFLGLGDFLVLCLDS